MSTPRTSPRQAFAATTTDLVASRADVAVVFAEISGQYFEQAQRRHPDLVGSAGSFDIASGGRSHQSPGDVALIDTLPEVTIHAPSTAVEVETVLRQAVADTGLHYVRVVEQTNTTSHPGPGLHVIRRGAGATVISLGPVLDDVLAATAGSDVTVLYAHTVRPFDSATLHAVVPRGGEVVLVEPWLEGTSAHAVSAALTDRAHRLLRLGVRRSPELRRYGSARDHIRAHGLDAAGLREAIGRFTGHR